MVIPTSSLPDIYAYDDSLLRVFTSFIYINNHDHECIFT